MMKGAVTWEEMLAELPQEDQQEIRQRSLEIVKAMRLQEIRELAKKKQIEVEGMTQAGVSRLEGRKDWLVSSVNAYVRGLGGTLKLVADLPDIGRVELVLDANGQIEAEEPPVKRRAKPAA